MLLLQNFISVSLYIFSKHIVLWLIVKFAGYITLSCSHFYLLLGLDLLFKKGHISANFTLT